MSVVERIMEGDVLHLDCTVQITEDNVNEEELFKVLKHLKPTWNDTDLICRFLQGGRINLSLHCFMMSNPDDSVVFRIWNQSTSEVWGDLINRRLEKNLIQQLGEKGVSPKLYASFTNGIVYEFFDGEKLTTALCRTDEMAKTIAKNFARIHGIKADGASTELQTFVFTNSYCDNDGLADPHSDKNERVEKIPSKKELKEETKFLEGYLKDLNCTVVQCHGDAHAQNMMYNKKTGKLIFLDYESAYTGYQPSDLASFFHLLTADFDDFTKGFNEKDIPNEEYQRKFLRWYLEEWFEITGRHSNDLTEKDVDKLYFQVNKYMLFTYFFSAIIFLKFTEIPKTNFPEQIQTTDWISLGKKFLQTYFEKKEYYMSLKVPE